MTMILGQRIKEEREKKGLTQEDLASTLNISRQAISKWELGTAYPDIERLIELSEFFNISLDSLIKGDPDLKESIIIKKGQREMSFWDFMARTGWMMTIAVIWIVGRIIMHVW